MSQPATSKALPSSKSSSFKTVLGIASGTMLGTAALVGAHHCYRKQRTPDASLQDYLTGLNARLQALLLLKPTHLPSQLVRLRCAYNQATNAYLDYAKDSSKSSLDNTNTNLAALYTTTMLARSVSWVSGVASMPQNTALDDDEDSCFGVVGIDADRQLVWKTTMPERVHDIVVQPTIDANDRQSKNATERDVVVMGRRPSEGFWVLDTANGQVKHAIKAAADRHFYGHACYSLDGTQLYITENDTVSLGGKIGIYEVNNNYQKIAEFDSHGIGPHELIMHPDTNTLVIANGGIKTEQASREELNLDSMRPSLVYLNRHNGELLQQIIPEHNQMSIRHLAMHDDGTVMIGIQFQGEKHLNVPLVLTHRYGDSEFKPLIMPNNQWQCFHQYIASVAVDSRQNLLCVTTPIGGCAAIYDLTTRKLIDSVPLPDCAGASILMNKSNVSDNISANVNASASAKDDSYDDKARSGFIVSDGQGQLTTLFATNSVSDDNVKDKVSSRIIQNSQRHKMSFDNHLQALL